MKIVLRAMLSAWVVFAIVVLIANLKLYAPSPLPPRDGQTTPSLIRLLKANRRAFEGDVPETMQQLFPEGYDFCFLFHGLTWVDVALSDESHRDEAIMQARWCLTKVDSETGRSPFPADLPPDHGMFYSAWKAHLRAGVVMLQDGEDAAELAQLRDECDAITRAIEQAETPFLASYRDSAWPCDSLPAIHALVTYDRITGERRYEAVVADWLAEVQARLDPQTGLISHTASLPGGRDVGVARATSQMIILKLMPDIDATFASSQYTKFREQYFTTFAGMPCVREYPTGVAGSGDVDSGPLIFGRSLSGTVLLIGVARIYGDEQHADAIARVGEVVGLPWTWQEEKRYVGGALPVGDAIVGYAHASRPWFSHNEHHPKTRAKLSVYWRWPVHGLSSLVLLPMGAFLNCRRGEQES